MAIRCGNLHAIGVSTRTSSPPLSSPSRSTEYRISICSCFIFIASPIERGMSQFNPFETSISCRAPNAVEFLNQLGTEFTDHYESIGFNWQQYAGAKVLKIANLSAYAYVDQVASTYTGVYFDHGVRVNSAFSSYRIANGIWCVLCFHAVFFFHHLTMFIPLMTNKTRLTFDSSQESTSWRFCWSSLPRPGISYAPTGS